jgi:signal transduction histidine kinase/CheY-like chemotaxis protein
MSLDIPSRLSSSFSTKVLLPVTAIMVLLLGITVWTIDRRITRQFESDAAASLGTAEAVFRSFQKSHSRNLLLRFHNLPKEPRYKALFQTGDPGTLKVLLDDLLGEQDVDLILATSVSGEVLASFKRDPSVEVAAFGSASTTAVKHALKGEENVDTVRVGERLFDVVCIPVFGVGEHLVGTLLFGSEIGEATAQQFTQVSKSQIALLADGRVLVSTLARPDTQAVCASIYSQSVAGHRARGARAVEKVLLDGEHYLCSAGKFGSLGGEGELGYLLLCSYEQPWQALHRTQQDLLTGSALGILAGTAIVWFLIRKVTQPLRGLRDSAEAVGRGDFSKRVQVISSDECGQLAAVFNRMTENLEHSRQQLERTVETLKTTQAQLVQSEKLSGIGEFVAGVAHELNNPLSAVMGFSELLANSGSDPQQKRHLEMVYKSAQRCQKIVQSLLSFARRHQPERKLSNVNALVENTVEFLQYQLRTSNIEVIKRLDPGLPQAMLDPHQLQQVFLNLINNARQAIEAHQPTGQITITTRACGQTLQFVFQDNGPGIAAENLSKVFDPFFTTKEVGKGTGLGLSLCYGIVREHGGTIIVSSPPGQGAMFTIDLPMVAEGPLVAEGKKIAEERPTVGGEGAGKKVLVIDDEEPILEMVRAALSRQGYQVDVARDGESALRRLNQTPYDLALCDWKMPGLNGQQVYERLSVSNPVLSERMIFITGDVINEKAQEFLNARKKVCLAKPFSLAEFRAAVAQALPANSTGTGRRRRGFAAKGTHEVVGMKR